VVLDTLHDTKRDILFQSLRLANAVVLNVKFTMYRQWTRLKAEQMCIMAAKSCWLLHHFVFLLLLDFVCHSSRNRTKQFRPVVRAINYSITNTSVSRSPISQRLCCDDAEIIIIVNAVDYYLIIF
jgi:hypothetical protein